MRKPLMIILLTLTLLAGLTIPAVAFEMDDEGVIAADQVINDDLFIEAETVVIDGTVNGNAFVNAAEVIVNGPINGNLLIFGAIAEINAPVSGSVVFMGQSLDLNSRINGSLFAAGASVVLNPQADIGLNLYYVGYNLQAMPGSKVGVDISVGCYQAILAGGIARDVHGGMSALALDGDVGGDVNVEVDEPSDATFSLRFGPEFGNLPDGIPSGIRISEAASIGGTLTYTSPVEQADTIAIPQEQVVYQVPTIAKKITPAEEFQKRFLSAGRDFITLLILGLLASSLICRPFQNSSTAAGRVLPSLGWGMVIVMVAPLVVILLGASITVGSLLLGVVTLGSLSTILSLGGYLLLALLVLAFLVVLVYASRLIVANAVGLWVCRRFWPEGNLPPFVPMLIGIALFVLLALVPVAGELFNVFIALIGLGAMWVAYHRRNIPPEVLPSIAPAGTGEMSEGI